MMAEFLLDLLDFLQSITP